MHKKKNYTKKKYKVTKCCIKQPEKLTKLKYSKNTLNTIHKSNIILTLQKVVIELKHYKNYYNYKNKILKKYINLPPYPTLTTTNTQKITIEMKQ